MIPSADLLATLLRDAGVHDDGAIAGPIPGGANNRVYRVDAGGRRFLLKCYFHDPGDRRDRLHAEYAFTSFAWAAGVRALARPLACSPASHVGLYEWCAGRRMRPADVDVGAVQQAVTFYQAINEPARVSQGGSLPLASEACFSVSEHLAAVTRRVDRLHELCGRDDETDRAARRFVERELREAWDEVEHETRLEAEAAGIDPAQALDRSEWRLSPSDFGFHNALRDADGRLTFIDFEYAGWDDPAKTACDFLCQPQLPVPQALWRPWLEGVLSVTGPRAAVHGTRIRVLYPVYRIKWICIMLNEFLPVAQARRRFADPARRVGRKVEQLRKSVDSLARLRSWRGELAAVV